jgi:hypothetical protein
MERPEHIRDDGLPLGQFLFCQFMIHLASYFLLPAKLVIII